MSRLRTFVYSSCRPICCRPVMLVSQLVGTHQHLHTSPCRAKRNYYFIPPYEKNDPVTDEPRTEVIESAEDFKHVERLLPPMQVPSVPEHSQYPTPSGWSPPSGSAAGIPYNVSRTRFHSIPVFIETRNGSQHWTLVKNIKGDIWAMAEDLKSHLEEFEKKEVPVTVNEVTMKIRYKGLYEDRTKEWLIAQGF